MARGSGGKKKGTKGKKARQKAKLDRHWGHHVDEDEIKAAKYRKGRSRSGKQRGTGGGNVGEKEKSQIKNDYTYAPPPSFNDATPSDSDGLTGSDSDSDKWVESQSYLVEATARSEVNAPSNTSSVFRR